LLEEKLKILGDAAKYDASCSSSGSGRAGKDGFGNAHMAGICHTWAADGRCISLLKVLMSNDCMYNCSYCVNRRSNDVPRATFTPEELAALTSEFYRRNYIEGLFLSSAVVFNPDYTMERMVQVLRILRKSYRFYGYIHLKVIPGCDPLLLYEAGLLADRLSVNIEMPSEKSLKLLAPQKKKDAIIKPMESIKLNKLQNTEERRLFKSSPMFAPAGQTTQMIIGATPDTDFSILQLSKSLYRRYNMKRVYFSAYIPVGRHPVLPGPEKPAPLLREHRLYQADWLMRFYQFDANEIVDSENPNLDPDLDPKCAWALRHPEFYPVEVNTADYEMLLRVPGIGVTSARRIIEARRHKKLEPEDLRKMGCVMKRAQYFVTAKGRYTAPVPLDSPLLRDILVERTPYPQLSLFDTPSTPLLQSAGRLSLSDSTLAALQTVPLPAGAKFSPSPRRTV
jgi:putative DNA modification/repair radical SAM protein